MRLLEKVLLFTETHRAASHAGFWGVVLLLAVSNSSYNHPDFTFPQTVVNGGLPVLTQALAAYLLGYFFVPQFLKGRRIGALLVGGLAGAYLVCVLSRLLIIHVAEPFIGQAPKPEETLWNVLTNWWKLVYVYFFLNFSLAFVFVFFRLLKQHLAAQQRALTLEKQKAETELRLLKTQLNPHFLFNTLNNLYALALMQSTAVPAAIEQLSAILDYMLYRCNARFVPVADEVALLHHYIGLEKLRYDDRLRVRVTTHLTQPVKIAPLLLLTVVENAFKHGASGDAGRPVIDIDLHADAQRIEFRVANSYVPQPLAPDKKTIGLPNLAQQLALLYPRHHTLTIHDEPPTFTVILAIDLP